MKDGISWDDAKLAAATQSFNGIGGQLAAITSEAENNFLRDEFATTEFTQFAGSWIAARFDTGTWAFTWRTGPLTDQAIAYSNWGGIEPNNANQSTDSAYMNIGADTHGVRKGQWADAASGGYSFGDPVVGYFVVYAPVPEPETYAMMLAGLGLMGLVAKRRSRPA